MAWRRLELFNMGIMAWRISFAGKTLAEKRNITKDSVFSELGSFNAYRLGWLGAFPCSGYSLCIGLSRGYVWYGNSGKRIFLYSMVP